MRFCIDPSWGEAIQKHSRLELSPVVEGELILPDTIFDGTLGDEDDDDRQEIRKEGQNVSELFLTEDEKRCKYFCFSLPSVEIKMDH